MSVSEGKSAESASIQQQPNNKCRKQSKPVRISSHVGNDENAAVAAFLAAQMAAVAASIRI